MKKLISLIVIGVVSVFILVGCGSKEPYMGEFEYLETIVDANYSLTEEVVQLMCDEKFKDTTIEIKSNGKAYFNEGGNSYEHSYSVSETNFDDGVKAYIIKFTDTENLLFIYDSRSNTLALDMSIDTTDAFCFFTRIK